MSRVTGRGIYLCPKCGGRSQIEYVNADAGYNRRSRACVDCGTTWSTVEIGLLEFKYLRKLGNALKRMLKEVMPPEQHG